MEKDNLCKWKPKKAGVAILLSGKIDFKSKTIKRQSHKMKRVNSLRGYHNMFPIFEHLNILRK